MYRERFVKLIVLGVLFFLILYFGNRLISSISGNFYLNNPTFHILFSLNLILLLILFVFFIRNLFLYIFPKRTTKLRVKLFTAFTLLVIGPSLFVVFLSSSFVSKSLDRLFRIQFQRGVKASVEAVDGFRKLTVDDLKKDIHYLSEKGNNLRFSDVKKHNLTGFFNGKRSFGEIDITPETIETTNKKGEYSFVDIERHQFVLCLSFSGNVYCASKKVPESLIKGLSSVEELRKNYRLLKLYENPIKAVYTLTFLIVGLAVIFGALWFAKYFERRITIPLEALHNATQEVSSGNLNVRVDELGTDELKSVITAFNYMVEQLRSLKVSLESGRRYIENILDNIAPAVITIDKEGKVKSCNLAAKKLFPFLLKQKDIFVVKAFSSLPLLKKAVQDLLKSGGGKVSVEQIVNGRDRNFTVELIVPSGIKDRILIIEDVTEIVNAQKVATWREVAQRLAHEIKNPLTPIVLNAERIRRSFKKGSENLNLIIDKSVSSILEEVEIIRRLIDEFRTFARLPLPEKKFENLNEIIRNVLEPFGDRVKVVFDFKVPISIPIDRSLFREVLINLVENSIDAGATEVKVSTDIRNNKVFVFFRDNGSGIPEEMKEKVFSPYISTKKGGWGLGLSIAQRIVADHGGKLYLADSNTFIIELPI